MEDILSVVANSLHDKTPHPTQETTTVPEHKSTSSQIAVEVYEEVEQETWEYDTNQMEFDDTGEGAGVEGDLDVDDD